MITVGSICTGFGGLDLALDLAGIDHELAWCSEIDPTACTVLDHHWPNVPNLGDINHANPPPVDLITAGFPCQDISHAGRQAGIHGERSGLWWTIRDVIGHLRPRYVLLENVAAILTNGGPAVVASLTGLGYDCRWGIVRAADVGAPHQRRRWFCIANATGERLERPERQSVQERPAGRPASSYQPAADTYRTGGSQPFTLTRRSDTTITTHDQRPVIDPESVGRQRARQAWRRRAGPENYGRYAPAVARWQHITGRTAPPPRDYGGRLNPRAVEWMMGLPWRYVDHGSRAAQLRLLGNGVVPQQAAHAIRLLSGHPTNQLGETTCASI